MEKLLLTLLFCISVSIVGYLSWLVRSPENRPEYYEQSKCEKVKEIIDKYEPKPKRKNHLNRRKSGATGSLLGLG